MNQIKNKMKNKNVLLALGLVAIGGYLLYKKHKSSVTVSTTTTTSSSFDGGWSNCNACSNADGDSKEPFWGNNQGWTGGTL